MAQWLELENSLPSELAKQSVVWSLLLNILSQNVNQIIHENAMTSLKHCLNDGTDETRQEFSSLLWSLLPGILSKVLIDFDSNIGIRSLNLFLLFLMKNAIYQKQYVSDTNARHILELATILVPTEVDQTISLKVAVLLSTIFTKTIENCNHNNENKYHFENVCLKLCLYLLGFANTQQDDRGNLNTQK